MVDLRRRQVIALLGVGVTCRFKLIADSRSNGFADTHSNDCGQL